jgi:hypothetical protein
MKTQILTKRKLQQGIVRNALIIVLMLIVGGYYGYNHYQEYQAAKTAFDQGSLTLAELKGSADKTKKDYLELKKEMANANSGVNQSIEKVLPANEDFTNLARELDKYFLNTTGSLNPMFLSDLRFSSPQEKPEKEFGELPFSMNITGDEDGFKEFLNYIENSGDLNEENRLLSISSVNLTYQQENSDSNQSQDSSIQTTPMGRNINASLNLNAFFQKSIKVE